MLLPGQTFCCVLWPWHWRYVLWSRSWHAFVSLTILIHMYTKKITKASSQVKLSVWNYDPWDAIFATFQCDSDLWDVNFTQHDNTVQSETDFLTDWQRGILKSLSAHCLYTGLKNFITNCSSVYWYFTVFILAIVKSAKYKPRQSFRLKSIYMGEPDYMLF